MTVLLILFQLQCVEKMESERQKMLKKIESLQHQVNEKELSMQAAKQQIEEYKFKVGKAQQQLHDLEKKYNKAKKIIKEFQKRYIFCIHSCRMKLMCNTLVTNFKTFSGVYNTKKSIHL